MKSWFPTPNACPAAFAITEPSLSSDTPPVNSEQRDPLPHISKYFCRKIWWFYTFWQPFSFLWLICFMFLGDCGRPSRAEDKVKIFPRNVWTSRSPTSGDITLSTSSSSPCHHHHLVNITSLVHCHHDNCPPSRGWTQCISTTST